MEHINNYKTILKPLKKVLPYTWKWDKKRLLILCVLTIILGSASYLQFASFAIIVNDIIDLQKSIGTYGTLVYHSILLLVTFFVPSILRQVQQYIFVLFRFNFLQKLSLMSIDEQAKLDIATVESTQFQDLITKANSRAVSIIYQVMEQGIRNLENVSGIIVASAFILVISPMLFVVALVTAVPSFYFYKKYGTQVWWIWDLNPQNRRKYFNRTYLFSNVGALTEIKLFNLKKRFKDESQELLESFDTELIGAEKKRFGYQLLIQILEIIGIAIVVWYLVRNGLAGEIAIGTLLLVFNSYRGLYNTFESFFVVLGYQDEFGKYASWWFELFDLKPRIVSKPEAVKPNWDKPPMIEFKNVSFKYDENDRYSLRDISFTLESGQKTALVGLNGAGKTTLIKLLCRVYDPTEGKILVDGIDLSDIDLNYWQSCLGILFQDFTHFNVTVAESIALGNTNTPLSLEKVVEASKKATSHDFILKYPKKYDQMLWKGYEDGVEPSKGERQKIAVARIFYRNALISVLDEPTSAIDAPSEEAIFSELDSMPSNRSAIMISHRMSAIKNADKIVVLKNGRIIEEGTHRALMHLEGEYSKLYLTQAKRMVLEEEVES